MLKSLTQPSTNYIPTVPHRDDDDVKKNNVKKNNILEICLRNS